MKSALWGPRIIYYYYYYFFKFYLFIYFFIIIIIISNETSVRAYSNEQPKLKRIKTSIHVNLKMLDV